MKKYLIGSIIAIIIILALFICSKLTVGLHSFTIKDGITFKYELCGYKNFFGFTVIQPRYTYCGGFYNGVAHVKAHTLMFDIPEKDSEYIMKHWDEDGWEYLQPKEDGTVNGFCKLKPKYAKKAKKLAMKYGDIGNGSCINEHGESVHIKNCHLESY